MTPIMLEQRLLKRGQTKEVALLGNPLDLTAADGATSIHQLRLRHEHFVDRAIPALVSILVDEASRSDPAPERLRGGPMTRLGGANEVVVRDVQVGQDVLEF